MNTEPAGAANHNSIARLWCITALFLAFSPLLRAENWPAWRGPRGDGTSIEKDIPFKWSNTENVVWKTPLPGKGHASPIVWEDRLFLVTAIAETDERLLLAIDVKTGKILWRKTILTVPFERLHALNSRASSTPATDGEKVFVSFLDRDKMFVAAYDFEGKMIWEVRPGPFASKHGYCSSPILWKDKVIVNGDHDGPAYIVALDKETGKTIWKTPRPNNTRSYCAPIIRQIDGRNQMVLSGSKCVASYDPDTGAQHWIIDGPTEQYVASLVYNGEYLFMTCGFPDRYVQLIDPKGRGNVTKTHVVFQGDQDCSYVPSPIAAEKYFLVVSDTGVVTCYDGKTGKTYWRQRLDGRHSASPVSAEGLVYFISDKGQTTVVKPADEFTLAATNDLNEKIDASPAISSGKIYLRTWQNLYCIGAGSQ
ncbi:MAG: PQQ-binding-like beta-propeller repeat protein [Sedimentisphaerales bacterium]|nr:PQQ-binding-like beta-propeller repeat protein [Sedimentisphaerales bacterium]